MCGSFLIRKSNQGASIWVLAVWVKALGVVSQMRLGYGAVDGL